MHVVSYYLCGVKLYMYVVASVAIALARETPCTCRLAVPFCTP